MNRTSFASSPKEEKVVVQAMRGNKSNFKI
jgi:hypothetical protein